MSRFTRPLTFLFVFSALCAQEVLSNETILKLAKAGISDDVILNMVSRQPGHYSVDSGDIIALKQGGISDKAISAIVAKAMAAPSPTPVVPTPVVPTSAVAPAPPASSAAPTAPVVTLKANPTSSEPMLLRDSTAVRLRLSRNLSSADTKTGDTIDFEVLDEIKVDDVVIIQRGSTAIGSITDSEKKGRMAHGGKLDVTIDYVRLATGDKVALRVVKDTKGGGHAGAMTGAMVATALVAWPAAPLFLFMHGKDVTIPKGTEITAYVNGDIKLDRQKFQPR